MGDDYELKDKIEIPLDKNTKLIIEPNYRPWTESVNKSDGIYIAMADAKDDDDRKLAEISLGTLEELGYEISRIISKLHEIS